MCVGVEMEQHQRVGPVRACPGGPATASTVGSDDEHGRRLGEDRAISLRELRLRLPREPRIRLVHAAPERAEAEGAPEDGEHEEANDSDHCPEPPAAALGSSRRARRLRRGARWRLERDLALLAAAAIQPVGLRSLGHAGRYGSPRRGGPRRPDESLMPLAVCATPIGNLNDVTLRVLDELRAADLVLCEDTRHTRVLLDRHGISSRLLSYQRHNEAARIAQVLERLRAGERVALVSDAGLPGVNDPGGRLIAAAVAQDVDVTVLPGASAVETALVVERAGRRSLSVRRVPPAARRRAALPRRGSSVVGGSGRRVRVAPPPPGVAARAR